MYAGKNTGSNKGYYTGKNRGNVMPYKPTPEIAEILNRCLERVKALPYQVTLRWLFYRIMGEKAFGKKKYKDFKGWTSKARKKFWNGWRPDTLPDDTREIHYRGGGHANPEDWVKSFLDKECRMEKFSTQQRITLVCFEAEAMYRQFEYYARPYYVSLIPFRGDTGIEHKWRIAKLIESLGSYGKPITVLYFGDLDTKGRKIPGSAFKDIRAWCSASFEYHWVGLTASQVRKYHLPDNPERPGQYQWEALEDKDAGDLITSVLDQYVDLVSIRAVERREGTATRRWQELLRESVDRFHSEE